MSAFYELLKKKAKDETKKDEMVIVGRHHDALLCPNYYGMTYSQILHDVDAYISIFNDPECAKEPIAGKRAYLVADNSIDSIMIILALLECGVTPVIIDAKNIPDIKVDSLPYLDLGNYEDKSVEDSLLEDYLKRLNIDDNITLPGENKPGSKLIICSSGSEGNAPHLNVVHEDELLNLPNQYGDNDSIFLSYISCANISGILTNIVNFLKYDTKLLLTQGFDLETLYFADDTDEFFQKNFRRKYEEKRYLCSTANPALMKLLFKNINHFDGIYYDQIHLEGDELVVPEMRENYQMISYNDVFLNAYNNGFFSKPDTMMFPRNILRYLENADLEGIDLSSMRHIYLAGGINREDVVRKVREKIPSIPKGVFTNLYGSTEANGIICTCDEKDFRTCYINVEDYESGKIRYTFNKEQFYEISDGTVKEISPPDDLFDYMPYLSASSKKEDKVTVDDKLNIKYNGEQTGDIGIYIDNQLYVLGRASDLIKLNGRTYIANSLEAYYSDIIGSKVYVRQIDEDTLQLFMKENKIKYNEDFINRYKKGIDISEKTTRFKVNPPVVIDDFIFEESPISGKISKPNLQKYEKYAYEQYNNFKNYPDSIIEKSIEYSKFMGNYSPKVLPDGSFLISLVKRVTMPLVDITLAFYHPTEVATDVVKYIPKPEIMFLTDEHLLYSNDMTYRKYDTSISEAIFSEALRLKNSGVDLLREYRPLRKDLTGEELVSQLKVNMMCDVLRRYIYKMQYQKFLESLTPEELERHKQGLPIGEKNDSKEDVKKLIK